MSYRSRVYRQRNPDKHDDKQKPGFFSKKNDDARKGAFFQAKMEVNEPGDRFEQEADTVANAVASKSNEAPIKEEKGPAGIQKLATSEKDEEPGTNDERMKNDKDIQEKPLAQAGPDEKKKPEPVEKTAPKKEEEDKKTPAVQKKEEPGQQVPQQLEHDISSGSGKGRPMPKDAQHRMEKSFNADFSGIRIHDDNHASELSRDLGAQAFTHGNDIYFNKGKFDPATSSGQQLLAHELTHTIQQTGGKEAKGQTTAPVQRKVGRDDDLQSPRFADDDILEKCFDNKRLIAFGDKGDHVKKIQQAMIDTGISMPVSTKKTGTPDGIFLSETKEAVKQFQRNCGLQGRDVDGIIGPITMGLFDVRFPGQAKTGPPPPVPSTRKTLKVNITRLHGSKKKVNHSLAFANTILIPQANVEVVIANEVALDELQTIEKIGKDEMLEMHFFDKVPSEEEKVLFKVNQSGDAIAGYFVKEISEKEGVVSKDARGFSITPGMGFGFLGVAIGNGATNKTFAHELGHVLGIEQHHLDDPALLMGPGSPGARLTAEDIKQIRENSFVK
jgi:peptidoglycan hydrolase-like protein with peptidoglycan-binding domain